MPARPNWPTASRLSPTTSGTPDDRRCGCANTPAGCFGYRKGTRQRDVRKPLAIACSGGENRAMDGLDREACYRAVTSRDTRFDGWFYTAVHNWDLLPPQLSGDHAETRQRRLLPHGSGCADRGLPRLAVPAGRIPGSPEWDVRSDLVARAMRLIRDGVIDRDGVAGLAGALGYTQRHVTRLLTEELGAGPLPSRAHRARTARTLLESTSLSAADIAFAAGFGSVRQFNDTIREVYAVTPSALRSRRRVASGSACGLPRGPRSPAMCCWVSWDGVRSPAWRPGTGPRSAGICAPARRRSSQHHSPRRSLPRGAGIVRPARSRAAVSRLRRDARPGCGPGRRRGHPAGDSAGRSHSRTAQPGRLRSGGNRDPGGSRPTGQRRGSVHSRRQAGRRGPHFPSSAQIAQMDPAVFAMPRRRAATVIELAARLADGTVVLDPGSDWDEVERSLWRCPASDPGPPSTSGCARSATRT